MGILFWRKSQSPTYSVNEVKFIFEQILIRTIDRENIKNIMLEQLSPIVGDKVVRTIYEELNKQDKDKDREQIKKWMERLNDIKDQKIFD